MINNITEGKGRFYYEELVNYEDSTFKNTQNQETAITRTLRPTVTGGSIVGIVYKDGIMVATDTLASYGSMARFKDVCRIRKLGDSTIFASSGEISDFQKICNILNEEVKKDWTFDDNTKYNAYHYSSFLSRILYTRKVNMNPLWTTNIVCGYIKKNENQTESDELVPFMGYVDLYGTFYEDKCIATGLGRYFALSLIRKEYKPNMTESEARYLIEESMRILYYRDCCASRRIQIAVVTPTEIKIEDPYILDTKWDYKDYTLPTISLPQVGCSW